MSRVRGNYFFVYLVPPFIFSLMFIGFSVKLQFTNIVYKLSVVQVYPWEGRKIWYRSDTKVMDLYSENPTNLMLSEPSAKKKGIPTKPLSTGTYY